MSTFYIIHLLKLRVYFTVLVESAEFKDFIQLLRPETRVVKADALKNWIMDRFIKTKIKMKDFFSSMDSRISFTTDIYNQELQLRLKEHLAGGDS